VVLVQIKADAAEMLEWIEDDDETIPLKVMATIEVPST
jgi:hypothetical protein